MNDIRRKGVAIVVTKKGILVVAGKSKKFALPGGGANRLESRKKATIRELYEETGLKTKKIEYLFESIGEKWHTHGGRLVKNHTKVFLVEVEGIPKPRSEIRYVDFWKPNSNLNLSGGTKRIFKKYFNEYKKIII